MVQSNYFPFTHLFLILFLYVADAQILTQPLPTYIHHNWEPSFAITTGAVIGVLILLGLISVYIRKCTDSQYNIRTNNTLVGGIDSTLRRPCSCSQGINNELLNTFPIMIYSSIKDRNKGEGSLECAVCLNDFKDFDSLRLLPKCNHVFHPSCIHSWLCSHVTCPVCRANLNDSCEVSITVETHLSTPQRVLESPSFLPEQVGGEENNNNKNPIEQSTNQVLSNLKECEGNNDFGLSKLKLFRSNSTGHSVLESEKNMEKYTLMLPEDVKKCIIVNHNHHGRRVHGSVNYNNNVMMPMLESSRKCWSYSEEYNNMRVMLTPPIVTNHD